jgi:hypothetical protein
LSIDDEKLALSFRLAPFEHPVMLEHAECKVDIRAGAGIVRQLLHAHHGVFAAVILGDVSD